MKDMIISSGLSVYPAEIEAELLRHAGVEVAAVVDIADEKWGEAPIAFLVPQPGIEITADELIRFPSMRLSKIKLPKTFVFIEALPRTAYGKIFKNELRARSNRCLRGVKFVRLKNAACLEEAGLHGLRGRLILGGAALLALR